MQKAPKIEPATKRRSPSRGAPTEASASQHRRIHSPGAENAEASGRELERRAKRYWILRYLERHALDGAILAYVMREGQSAELADFAVRGTLHGAPSLPNQMPIMVQVSRVDPLRGWLSFDFVGPADESATGAIRTV